MYKDNLKDIVAGDIVILRDYGVEFSLVTVISVMDDKIITNDTRMFTRDGTGISYPGEYILAPLELMPRSELTALKFYHSEQENLVRRELITRIRKFHFSSVSTATIKTVLDTLSAEVSKHA